MFFVRCSCDTWENKNWDNGKLSLSRPASISSAIDIARIRCKISRWRSVTIQIETRAGSCPRAHETHTGSALSTLRPEGCAIVPLAR